MPLDQIKRDVSALVGQCLIPRDFPFYKLGFEFADFMVLQEGLNQTFDAEFDFSELMKCNTIDQLSAFVYDQLTKNQEDGLSL